VLEYDAAAGILRLSREAWLAEDGREISGSVLTYDINAERVVADRGEEKDSRVRIIIDPASLEQQEKDGTDDDEQ
jgi:lipopolysaccharide export system protein LptA